jgi:outer membrane receptor protein involved in Fe transport
MAVQREWIRTAVLYVVALVGWGMVGLPSAWADDVAPLSEEIDEAEIEKMTPPSQPAQPPKAPARQPVQPPKAPAKQPAKAPATSPSQPPQFPVTSPSQPAKTPEASASQPVKASEPSEDLPEESVPTGSEEDELLMFEDIPVVISASRQKTEVKWLSIPTSIVSAEDIHYSGLTDIPEVLQFVPGVDVRRVDRNRYSVGVQGPSEVLSDKTLVLIDGRSAYSQFFGGAEWLRFPLILEDIKRIEVVRGPGGAAWGANAFTGMINVITKEPEDCLGYLASTSWDHFGDTYNQMRWADKQGKLSWRISTGYKGLKNSDRTGAGDYTTFAPQLAALTGYDTFRARDFNRSWVFDNKFVYDLTEKTKLSPGVAYSHVQTGTWEFFGYYPKGNARYETTRLFTRVDQEFSKDTTGYLQWFANLDNTGWANHLSYAIAENDIEGQLNFRLGKHHMSAGGNVRLLNIRDKPPNDPQAISLVGAPFKEQWAGAFLIDRWEVTDRLTLEGQFRGDWYSETQEDWSARASALYALDEGKKHIVRLSGAKAFRAPTVGRRTAEAHTIPLPSPPFPPNWFTSNLLPVYPLRNEEIYSLEAGYTGQLAKGLTFRADGYIQRCNDMIGVRQIPDPWGVRIFAAMDNIDDATAWGSTTELAYENKIGRLSAWYSYSVFQLEEGELEQDCQSYLPAKHKTGLSGRLFLPDNWVLNGNFRYTTGQVLRSILRPTWRMPDEYRLDLTVSKKVFKDHGEIMIGVSDLLNQTDPPIYDAGQLSAHDTPGRTFFVRFQLEF